MRTIGKILRWFIGIIVILMGWASTETDKITGILWILTGLLILPAVSKRIPQFKNRKAVLLVVCICLFVAGGMASSGQEQMPKTDQVGQAGGTDSSKKINKESKENEKTDGKKAVEPEITEGDTDRDADTVSDIRTETDASNNAVPTYSEETIKESLKVYSYEENPYYLEGLQRYVDGFNGLYVEMNAEQEVKILPLENILKEADVSWNMRRKILELEGKDILTNADFRRMEEKEDEDLFSILFSSKGPYLEVSSKAKDDIDEYDELLPDYYFGELKDNKPDGEGALFTVTDAGTMLKYAGDFKEGRMHGKGVLFKTDSLYPDMGAVVMEQGTYKDGSKDGKCIVYNYDEIINLYQMYKGNWADYENEYYSTYNSDERNQVLSYLLENDTFAELMYITSYYNAEYYGGYFQVRINYPVIAPAVFYEGGYKNGSYSGKGTKYGNLGTLWYQGEYKGGHYHGKGVLYYAMTGITEYDGEFKHGKADGKGTLYNEDGSVRKKGEFESEEIDIENELAQSMGMCYFMNDKFDEVGLQAFFEKDKMVSKSNSIENNDTENKDTKNDGIENNDGSEYIFADSSERLLDDWELAECDSDTLSLARNEIYARHGRRFNDEGLQKYFDSKTWYEGTILPEEFDDSVLNKYEKSNIDKIKEYE